MRETYKKHNHNQKGQFTKKDKTRYLSTHCLIADFVKVINDTTGLFDRLSDKKLDALDKRGRNIEYSLHFVLVVSALSCCLGISSVHSFASAFIEPYALENISCLAHEDTSMVIDYQAMNDAIAKMDDISWIEGIAQDICEEMQRSGRYRKYYKWYGSVVVIDATDFAFFRVFHCIHDLTATFHKGTREEKTYYFHKALVAHLFFTKTISFPIGIEFIENEMQNPTKQDCENEAAIRLLERIKKRFPETLFIICGDALYANRTFIRLCVKYHWNYLFTLKEGCQPSLCREFHSMETQGQTGCARVRYADDETGTVYWANDMGVIVNTHLPMNILRYQTTMTIARGDKKARGIQNAILRRKDIAQDMPELSKDQSKYNLDERATNKNDQDQMREVARKTAKSDKAKEDLARINAPLACEVDDGEISDGSVKEGGAIVVSFMYITNLHISRGNVGDLLVRGRSRWMIEEVFLREKMGTQRLEHLRTKNPMLMKYYFWIMSIADSCMQIYLDYSKAYQVFGSEKEVYGKLRESFEKESLEEHYDTGRECHWHYGDDRNVYPAVEILPDDDLEKTDQKQDEKVTSNASTPKASKPEKKLLNGSQASSEKNVSAQNEENTSCNQFERSAKADGSVSEPATGTISAETEGAEAIAVKSARRKSDVQNGKIEVISEHEKKEFSGGCPLPDETQTKKRPNIATPGGKKVVAMGRNKDGRAKSRTGPQSGRPRNYHEKPTCVQCSMGFSAGEQISVCNLDRKTG